MPTGDFRLRWSRAAGRDLRDIWRYYDRVASRDIADHLLRKLIDAGARAAERPLMRRVRTELSPDLRAVIVHPYTLFYRVSGDEVEVVRVLHERRDFEAVFKTKSRKT
jgi:toxin ParE1/3/4